MTSSRLSVLSLFLGLVLVSSSLYGLSPTSSLTISGKSAGTRTGLYLIAGDNVRLTAAGQVNTLPPDPGSRATPRGNGSPCTSSCLLPSAQFGALIGRIGEQGPWFLVGLGLTLNATHTGMLYLAVNDTIHNNNIGQFAVTTKVTANASFSCAASSTALCLRGDRFRVQVFWRLPDGSMGNGQVSSCGASESGIFWFFTAANLELLMKVLDGCGSNNSYWVFAAATTTLEFTLRVRDTHTGEVKMYFNPQGRPADALTDFSAFPGC
jgi:hypothetical protein